jgi:hypothetical protein
VRRAAGGEGHEHQLPVDRAGCFAISPAFWNS